MAVICGLLLLASAINYLDRQTMASASARVKSEFGLLNEQYGDVEAAFGYGFVIGSILFGLLADVVSIRWLYPVVLICLVGSDRSNRDGDRIPGFALAASAARGV